MKVADNFYRETAEELGISYDIVKKVNSFFWKVGVKENLSKANYTSIFIKNLGTIAISRYKIREEILDVIGKIRATKASVKYGEIKRASILNKLLTNLRQLLKRRNELAVEMVKRITNRNELSNRVLETDSCGTEECGQSSGRSGE